VAKPLDIAFVSSHAKSGGSEAYLEALLDRLGAESVRIVVSLEDGPLVDRLRGRGLDVHVLETGAGPRALARSARRLRPLLRRAGADIVHANGVKAALVAALARTPRLVWVKHDFSWDGPLAWLVAARSRRVVTVSRAVAATFPRPLRRRVRIVHTGIDVPATDRARARERLVEAAATPAGHALVGLIGRLHPVKGHEDLLAVAPRLRDRATIVLIGGPDPSQSEHGEHVRDLAGLHDNVVLLSHREDARELAAGLDVGVIASIPWAGAGREGFPLVGLELLAAGTPVVAYEGGGVAELVGDAGILVDSGDRDALGAAIIRLLDDDELRADMSRRGIERARDHFSVDGWVAGFRRVYEETTR
jgi:glycosyltransferase involved in cell wall biosynthesis